MRTGITLPTLYYSLGNDPIVSALRFQNGVNAPAEKYGRGVKFVSVSDIIQNDYVTYDNIVGCVDIDDATLERYSVENGDMVFQRSSETVEDIGRAIDAAKKYSDFSAEI